MPEKDDLKTNSIFKKLNNLNQQEKKRLAAVVVILLFIPLLLVIASNVRKNAEDPNVKAATSSSRPPMALGISLPYGFASRDVNVDAAIADIEEFAKPVDQGGVGGYPSTYSIWVNFTEDGGWQYGSRGSFPDKKLLDYLDSKNITPVIFLSPVGNGINRNENKPDEAMKYSNNSIANGSFDVFFNEFAASASAYGKPVIVRYAWEMNGTWFPWSPYSNRIGKRYYDVGNTPENYVSAWKHVYTQVKSKAPNVLFYWCANKVSGPNDYLTRFYPGNNYVDFVGFDAYNWYPKNGDNLGLAAEFDGSVQAIRKLVTGSTTKLSTKPIIVGETGLLVNNPDRISKFNYGTIYNNYADIAGIIYFNFDVDYLFGVQAEPGTNWRLSGKSENPAITTSGVDLRPKYASFVADSKFKGSLVERTPALNTPTPANTSTPTPSPRLTNTPTPSPTPASVSVVINAKADAYVTSSSPKTNFGTATVLRAKASDPISSTYLKFTLPNLSGKTILSASLRFTTTNSDDAAVGNANKLDIKNTSNNWTQEALTYSNKPASGSVVGTKSGAIAKNTTFEINVLPGVQGKSGDVSFVLESTASNANNLIVYSSNASNKPVLIITYR